MENKNIMEPEKILPVDFDGTFRFTNWTDHDFVGVWNSKQYSFPAQTTVPMIITDQTPLEIQQIRKKFAKDLAEQEFFRSKEYDRLRAQERNTDNSPRLHSIHMAGTYSDDQLVSFIQRCLEPLPAGVATVSDVPRIPTEEKLNIGDDGEPVTKAIDKRTSLRKKALEA